MVPNVKTTSKKCNLPWPHTTNALEQNRCANRLAANLSIIHNVSAKSNYEFFFLNKSESNAAKNNGEKVYLTPVLN